MENFDNKKAQIHIHGDGAALPQGLPFRVLVAGKFSRQPDAIQPQRVDTDSFPELLKRMQPGVELSLAALSGDSRIPVVISLDDYKQFQPKFLLQHCQHFKPYLQCRDTLTQLIGRKINTEQCLQQLQPLHGHHQLAAIVQRAEQAWRDRPSTPNTPPPATTKSEPDSPPTSTAGTSQTADLDALFDMVDPQPSDPEQSQSAAHGLQHVIENVTAGAGRTIPGDTRGMLNTVTTMMHEHLDSILHHPQWQTMEATWRGLKLLLDECDFREPIRVEIINLDKENLTQSLPQLEQSLYHDTVPANLLLAAYQFHRSDKEFESLQAIAECAQSLQLPTITAVRGDFFGQDITHTHHPGQLLQQSGYEKWRSLRDKDCSRWIAVAFNDPLLREVYQNHGSSGYVETVNQEEELLWGNPVWALGGLICTTFAKTHWPTQWCAQQNQINGMALTPLLQDSSLPAYQPLRRQLILPVVEDLGQSGIVSLASQPDRDGVFCLQAQSLHQTTAFNDKQEQWANRFLTSLNYHLLLNRIIHAMNRFRATQAGEHDEQTLVQNWQRFFNELLVDTGPGYQVHVSIEQADDQRLISLGLQTGRAVLGGVPVNLQIPL